MINPKGSSEAVLKVDDKDTVTLTELPALELLVRRLQLGLVLDGTHGKQIRIEEIVTVIDQDVMDSAVIGQGHVNYDVIDKDQVNHAVIGQNQVGSNLMVEVKKDAIKETAELEMMNNVYLREIDHLKKELKARNARVGELENKLEKSSEQVQAMQEMFAVKVKSNGETESKLDDVKLSLCWCQNRLRKAEIEISFLKQVHGVKDLGGVHNESVWSSGCRGSVDDPQSLNALNNSRNLGPGILGPAPFIPRPVLLASLANSHSNSLPILPDFSRMAGITQCEDFMLFQKALKRLRVIDDKIIYALNQSTPTASFQARGVDAHEKCLNLREELTESHRQRGEHIKNCSVKLGADIAELRAAYEGGNKDVRSDIKIKTGKLRMFENELSIEEIIQERTETIFKSKCQEFL